MTLFQQILNDIMYKIPPGLEVVKKVWGYEIILTNNGLYCGKLLLLKQQHQCSFHMHKVKDETFYVLDGTVWFTLKRRTDSHSHSVIRSAMNLYTNIPIRIFPEDWHSFLGISDAIILEISTQDESEDSYRQSCSCRLSDREFSERKSDLTVGVRHS